MKWDANLPESPRENVEAGWKLVPVEPTVLLTSWIG